MPLSRQQIVPHHGTKVRLVETRIDPLIPLGGDIVLDREYECGRVCREVLVELPPCKIGFLVRVGEDTRQSQAVLLNFRGATDILRLVRRHSMQRGVGLPVFVSRSKK